MISENRLLTDKHILICLSDEVPDELNFILTNFCGRVIRNLNSLNIKVDSDVYLCGDIKSILENISFESEVFVIEKFSWNYDHNCNTIDIGKIPINIFSVGLLFKNFFDNNYFEEITHQHQFQTLTESNKQSNAFRKGIYLTKVEKFEDDFHYRLLRCSSNFEGPTDNFREADETIVGEVNKVAKKFFETETELNHVLAQIYENRVEKGIDKKARISAHSDKTKDMPKNGLMAFCTFYKFDEKVKISVKEDYDITHRGVSVLSNLYFRLKSEVTDSRYPKEFSITLYPNSVFLMSLETNRLYTHEIRPSLLPVNKIPIRMGYVIRCSKTKAIFRNNETFIEEEGNLVKLEKITDENIRELRNLYYLENTTTDNIHYGSIYYSMNKGDYMKPIL